MRNAIDAALEPGSEAQAPIGVTITQHRLGGMQSDPTKLRQRAAELEAEIVETFGGSSVAVADIPEGDKLRAALAFHAAANYLGTLAGWDLELLQRLQLRETDDDGDDGEVALVDLAVSIGEEERTRASEDGGWGALDPDVNADVAQLVDGLADGVLAIAIRLENAVATSGIDDQIERGAKALLLRLAGLHRAVLMRALDKANDGGTAGCVILREAVRRVE